MTRKRLYLWVNLTIAIYGVALVIGIALRWRNSNPSDPVYGTYKDLSGLIIALPAAWLVSCFQRRASYLQQLRIFWSNLVDAVQEAIQYTHLQSPSREEFAEVNKALSRVIDEIRALFRNLEEGPAGTGYYPFESIKEMQKVVSSLGFGPQFEGRDPKAARTEILRLWKAAREPLLREFDRGAPTYTDSPFAKR